MKSKIIENAPIYEHFVFIYAKDGKIKTLNIHESMAQHAKMNADGWKHTATLNACIFIEYLHNDSKHIGKDVKSLQKIKKNERNII